MLIDSHTHLENERLDAQAIIESMEKDGLEKIVTIGTNVEKSKRAVQISKENKNVYATVGIHPEYASEVTEQDLMEIDKLASEEKVVAIGEIGLDYYGCNDNFDKQVEIFVKQIQIAKKHNLPICIHSRSAKSDTYKILKENINDIVLPSIIHCFSEDGEYAQKFLDLGFYLSFAGNITYKKSDRSYLKDIPNDKILVETDAPFLSPEPMRGKLNEPARVALTALRIADEKEMDFETFCKHTVENTYRVYKKMKRD